MNGFIMAGESLLINTNQIAYAVFDDDGDDGVLLRLTLSDSDQDELILSGSKATALWDQLQRGVLDM